MTDPVITWVLVGAPGVGKTTIGALLADEFGLDFVDVDALIEQREGTSITQIFAERGEPAFRELELAIGIAEIAKPGVVSLGGGAVLNEALRDELIKRPAGRCVIWLQASAAEALGRIGNTQHRPLLAGDAAQRLTELMTTREHLYSAVADLVVATDGLTPAQVVQAILEQSQ